MVVKRLELQHAWNGTGRMVECEHGSHVSYHNYRLLEAVAMDLLAEQFDREIPEPQLRFWLDERLKRKAVTP